MDLRSLPPSGVLSLCLCRRERVVPPFQDVALSAVAPAPDTPAGHWLASLETVGEGCMPSSHNHQVPCHRDTLYTGKVVLGDDWWCYPNILPSAYSLCILNNYTLIQDLHCTQFHE